ncbi:hypothetical protein BDB01DRAFT_506598 [Pilobolus umbonatus]|nr:hypothetical protein BDB01DRAFT_506598 [Pilobolus umbonatus]
MVSHNKGLLLFYLAFFTSCYYAQTLDSVWFQSSNYSYCNSNDHISVSSVYRYFNVTDSAYSLIINGTSDIQPATDQGEPASNIYWTSLKILYGFQLIHAPNEILCHDLKGCSPYSSLPYERLFNITSIPSYPLSDIMAEYSIVSIDKKPVFCLQIAPVGYQHPVWRNIFIFIPVAITLIAAMISFVVSVIGFNVNENYDIILFTSNYATVPGVLKLKTPGFFDLMFYAQFIVLLSQFNLEYPRFYPLFSSNFSWSFLLYNAKWLQSVLVQQFPSAALNKDSPIHNEPGLSLYRRQLNDSSISNNGSMITKPSNHVTVDGTGMADFSNAIGIDINGLFLNMIVHLAIVLGACLVVCLFVYIFLYLSGRIDRSGSLREKMKRMNDFFIADDSLLLVHHTYGSSYLGYAMPLVWIHYIETITHQTTLFSVH